MNRIKYPDDAPAPHLRLPNCGVIAVAMLAGVSYKEAREVVGTYREKGNCPQWRGITYERERVTALIHLGVPLVPRPDFEDRTLHQLYRDEEAMRDLRVGTFMLTAGRHVVVVHAGKVYDNFYRGVGRPIEEVFKGRRQVVYSCPEVRGTAQVY